MKNIITEIVKSKADLKVNDRINIFSSLLLLGDLFAQTKVGISKGNILLCMFVNIHPKYDF